MNFYCGIDLSARDSHLCVIDEQLKALVDVKVKNDLARMVKLLEPYKPTMKIVVESTFNWYWLVDGLRAEGFQVLPGAYAGTVNDHGSKGEDRSP